MKIFDNWIKKQYHKRFIKPFRDTMPEPKLIVTKKPIMKSIQMIMLAKEADDLVDFETKKMELAMKFIPVIANNIVIRKEEEPMMHMVKYEALLEFIPKEEDHDI